MMSHLTFILINLCVFTSLSYAISEGDDEYSETLLIKPLSDGHVYAHFTFTTLWHYDLSKVNWANRFNLFPLLIGKLIAKHEIQELHFSLTKGLWKHKRWGFPIRDASPGAELWVWFQHFHKNPSKSWNDVTKELSGQFCASINFIDNAATVQPKYSFRPSGVIDGDSLRNDSIFYAALPHETVCTENLTPLMKLLPCHSKSGLASLLDSGHLFNTFYFSLSVDLQPICRDKSCKLTSLELIQSISVVFNPPVLFEGKQSWSLVKLFGAHIFDTCKLSKDTSVYIDVSQNTTENPFRLQPQPSSIVSQMSDGRKYALFNVKELLKQKDHNKGLNIGMYFQKNYEYSVIVPPPLYATRFIKGFGLSNGGITCHIHNNLEQSVQIMYLDIIPWYLRFYVHTLQIKTNDGQIVKPHSIYYKPAKDRIQPHHLELLLKLPPKSVLEITYEFDRSYLKWTEYPPDANHGVYVDSAVISAIIGSGKNVTILPNKGTDSFRTEYFIRIHTETLLVSLPTPDFSMPYNVICLVSTVVSLAFGPIHNLTTRRAKVVSESNDDTTKKGLLHKLKNIFKRKPKPTENETQNDSQHENN